MDGNLWPRLGNIQLQKMGLIAVEAVLRRVARPDDRYPRQIVIETELVIRKSTAAVSTGYA
ncbi:MAG: hypothetical protein DMG78_12110 [Acidobacteria bacterium]|nr:MAG: hypothetical protein DMG78_12110 [Acidobacteriota bacterium]